MKLVEPIVVNGILVLKTLVFLSALASIITDDVDVVVVVRVVVDRGRRRLAECGKSNRPPLDLFCPEFNGDIVVQQAIVLFN